MPKQDWKNTDCPWNCVACAEKERMRDLALAVKPFYTEHIKPLKERVMEMRLGPFGGELANTMGICVWMEKTRFSSTKVKPTPLITLVLSRAVGLFKGEYTNYGGKPMDSAFVLISGEVVDGWLKMEVRDNRYNDYSSSQYLWLRPWDFDDDTLEIVPLKGWKCPECGAFTAERSCNVIAPDEETGEMERQFWCNCGFKKSLSKMGGHEAFQRIPEDLQKYVVSDLEMEMEECQL